MSLSNSVRAGRVVGNRARQLLCLLAVLVGCRQDSPESQAIALRLGDTPVFEICRSPTAIPECQWRSLRDVHVLSGGRFAVQHAQTDVFVFDRSGVPVGRLGRDGDGPGEFRFVASLAARSDSGVTALDARQFRINVYDSTLALIGSRTFEPSIEISGMKVSGDAVAVLNVATADSIGRPTTGTVEWVNASSGDLTKTVRFVARSERMPGTDLRPLPVPFSPRLLWDVSSAEHVAVAYGDEGKITVFDDEGRVHAVIAREWKPAVVTAEERDSVRESLLKPGGRPSNAAGYAAQVEERLRALPSRHPLFTELRFSTTSELWLRRGGRSGGSTRWERFTVDGEYRGELSLPMSDRLLRAIGDTVVLARRDSLGAEAIVGFVVYRDSLGTQQLGPE